VLTTYSNTGSSASIAVPDMGSDIVAILTGETDKNNLSATASLGAIQIASTYPAGWTVWDDDTGTANEWVLRAPCDGDAAQYKYVKLRFYVSSTWSFVGTQLMEDWNPSTNTATNACTEQPQGLMRHPPTSYGAQVLDIMSSNRYMIFRTQASSQGDHTMFPALELTRLHPCLGVGNGYLPAVQADASFYESDNLTTYRADIPRILDDAGTTDLTNQSIRFLATHSRPSVADTTTEFDSIITDVGYNSVGTPYYGLHLFLAERRELIGGNIGTSEVSNIWFMQGGVLAGFEDLSLHTLDTTDDIRCMWMEKNTVLNGGDPRLMIRAE